MTIANPNLRVEASSRKTARALKINESRLHKTLANTKVLTSSGVLKNDLQHLAESSNPDLPAGRVSVPLQFWFEHKPLVKAHSDIVAVQLAADQSVDDVASDLYQIDIIVLPITNYTDGRSYSHARNLRLRYNFTGEIRAVGDVHYDQLGFLARVGVDAFELAAGESTVDAHQAFAEISETYQPSADSARLIFSRRRPAHRLCA